MDTSNPAEDDSSNLFAVNLAHAMELVGNRNDCQFVATDLRTGEIVDHDTSEDILMSRIKNKYSPMDEMCFISIIHGVVETQRVEASNS